MSYRVYREEAIRMVIEFAKGKKCSLVKSDLASWSDENLIVEVAMISWIGMCSPELEVLIAERSDPLARRLPRR